MIVRAAADPQKLPSADATLLAPLKASAEFAAISPRVLTDLLLDSWQEDDLHFFVFRLQPVNGAGNAHAIESEAPVTVFVMHPGSHAPVSAVIVTQKVGSTDAEIQDLRSLAPATMNT